MVEYYSNGDGWMVFLTRGPPEGYLDDGGWGSEFLLTETGVRPQLVIFGHIHGGYGKEVV